MKVAFLIHSLEVNGCRYRVLQYLPYLKENGVDVSIHFFKKSWPEELQFYRTLGRYDLFYVHRKLFPLLEFWYVRRRARRIIYDFDDAVMYRSSSAKKSYSLSRRLKFGHMMKRVDFAIAGNQFLKSEVLPYNSNVEVIPTAIDLSRYTVKENAHPAGPITLGWMGSGSTLKYLKLILPSLERAYRRSPNFQLKIVCNAFLDSSTLPIVKKQWSADEEVADLKSFDIGIMPLSDDLWSRGKCGLKILQYFGVGVPVICSPVGANRDMVENGKNGFWAEDEQTWEERLLEMIRDEGRRRQMGLEGRKVVERQYSLEVNAPRVLDLLRKVAGF
jgi:glycosyltransferase involved in cell wall biosynthesis